MEQLAAHARSLEAHGDFQEAREKWLACLPLLPAKSVQAEWIRNHVAELGAGPSPQSSHPAFQYYAAMGQKAWTAGADPAGAVEIQITS